MRLFSAAFLVAALSGLSSLAGLDAADPTEAERLALVDRGLAALAKLQEPDGGFQSGTAATAIAGMALLAAGSTPVRGQYAAELTRAVQSLLRAQDEASGYLGAGYGNMYAHGFATLFLAECYGMAPGEDLRTRVEAAVDLIHRSQNAEGGWRYQPLSVDADISVTICQVMALRAAYNAGIGGSSSENAISRAIGYVRRCANGDGSFSYVAGGGGGWGAEGATGVPRSAAGAMSLIGSGVTDPKDPQLGPALRFLRQHFAGHLNGAGHYFWYGQYYCAQAMFHSPDPDDWAAYWKAVVPAILSKQNAEGLWTEGEGSGPAYASGMALVILQIPNNYLPIFQR